MEKTYSYISEYILSIESIAIIALGCLMVMLTAEHASGATENAMKRTSVLPVDSSEIPPIDQNTPLLLQTASFGLG
ncbi:hypothetical protein [Desulfofustis glycolicus]|uniref:Uncharacterized protein n=1 Tax=Desulfofustis glycolicus DSM 9705 TaxID=1121409 RepID=A0A1M5UPA1_9BACT|nr:hypothetical protein [Desulfofustis glycolicus]MCB2217375.1 hypothetical protein [Desulfobulbaceae bacterium]SHH64795.1 hypothetical protein SAMN02745124_01291 [Desulfofustis glycolicus DSM 9705]